MNQHAMPNIAAAAALASIEQPEPCRRDLQSLGAEFDAIHATYLVLHKEQDQLSAVFDAALAELQKTDRDPFKSKAWHRLRDETGLEANIAKVEAIWEHLEKLAERIRLIAPVTVADFHVRLKVLAFDNYVSCEFDQPERDMDWHVLNFHQLLQQVGKSTAAA